ncbi:hypothetical protein EDC01DRAFT_759009 [Geopyxis carbonaria]|nr:hypothetical protein EDC01DRAFT_759009 [Geopyxis carbonaria]
MDKPSINPNDSLSPTTPMPPGTLARRSSRIPRIPTLATPANTLEVARPVTRNSNASLRSTVSSSASQIPSFSGISNTRHCMRCDMMIALQHFTPRARMCNQCRENGPKPPSKTSQPADRVVSDVIDKKGNILPEAKKKGITEDAVAVGSPKVLVKQTPRGRIGDGVAAKIKSFEKNGEPKDSSSSGTQKSWSSLERKKLLDAQEDEAAKMVKDETGKGLPSESGARPGSLEPESQKDAGAPVAKEGNAKDLAGLVGRLESLQAELHEHQDEYTDDEPAPRPKRKRGNAILNVHLDIVPAATVVSPTSAQGIMSNFGTRHPAYGIPLPTGTATHMPYRTMIRPPSQDALFRIREPRNTTPAPPTVPHHLNPENNLARLIHAMDRAAKLLSTLDWFFLEKHCVMEWLVSVRGRGPAMDFFNALCYLKEFDPVEKGTAGPVGDGALHFLHEIFRTTPVMGDPVVNAVMARVADVMDLLREGWAGDTAATTPAATPATPATLA